VSKPDPAPRGARIAPAAALVGVWKSYGAQAALRGVDLEISPGEVLALLGPNGAGKTTVISLLLGLRRPDRGRAVLFGADPRRALSRKLVGAIPQEIAFPGTLRVRELVDVVRAHYTEPASRDELLERFGLMELRQRQAGGLSGGERRRLALALAFAGNPAAVFLDEPSAGLDVGGRRSVWESIRSYRAGGGTVLLTTHYLEEADSLASRVVVLDRGRVIAEGDVSAIKSLAGVRRVTVRAARLPRLPGVVRAARENGRWQLDVTDAGAVVEALVRHRIPLDGLEVLPVALEDAFLLITGRPS
jgi:ABC-2 type transport system ATP-binding protein